MSESGFWLPQGYLWKCSITLSGNNSNNYNFLFETCACLSSCYILAISLLSLCQCSKFRSALCGLVCVQTFFKYLVYFHLQKTTSLPANNVTETYSAFMVLFLDTYFMLTNHSTPLKWLKIRFFITYNNKATLIEAFNNDFGWSSTFGYSLGLFWVHPEVKLGSVLSTLWPKKVKQTIVLNTALLSHCYLLAISLLCWALNHLS